MGKTALFLSSLAGASALRHEKTYYESAFEQWKEKHGMMFHTRTEHESRFQIWCEKDDEINNHNEQKSSYKLGHNQFSHLTHDEFKSDRGLGEYSNYAQFAKAQASLPKAPFTLDNTTLTSVDWVTAGAVTAVKDQGQCGSCWAFSTTGALEGAYYLKYNTLKAFSEQNLVDCDKTDSGCSGGLMDNGFAWVKTNGGLCAEADYAYTSGITPVAGTCKTTCAKDANVAPKEFTDVTATEAGLMAAVAQQPVSIAIEADQAAFQSYSSGVLTASCGTSLDHGVLVVGYGTFDGTDYWKVKNSWGSAWGQDGYILLKRGNTPSECGITMEASYPTL